jgi:hypothetical protein
MKHKLLTPFLSVNIQITHYYNTEKGECLYRDVPFVIERCRYGSILLIRPQNKADPHS